MDVYDLACILNVTAVGHSRMSRLLIILFGLRVRGVWWVGRLDLVNLHPPYYVLEPVYFVTETVLFIIVALLLSLLIL